MSQIKLFMIVLITMMIVLPLVSSLDIDNVLNVESKGQKYPELTIKNTMGLGSDISKMKIIDDGSKCFIDCYVIINITLYEDDVLPNNFEAYNNDGKLVSKSWKYYILTENKKEVIIPNYKKDCKEKATVNGSKQVCETINDFNTTKETITYSWDKYNGEKLKAGTYTYRVETKKSPSEVIDWTFSFKGISSSTIKNHWAWWDSLWPYKKEINIQEMTGNNWTNYSIYLSVAYDNNMQPDFRDLRFTDGTETKEIPYFIESKVNSTSALVWVKTPLEANVNTTIYMYYGNTAVTTTSNSSKAFMLYDYGETNRSTRFNCTGNQLMGYDGNQYTMVAGTIGSPSGWYSCDFLDTELSANVTMTARVFTGTGYFGATIRGAENNPGVTFYREATFDTNTIRLSRWVGGSETHLITVGSLSLTGWQTYNITGWGKNITGHINTTLSSISDNAIGGAGRYGFNIYTSSAGWKIDNITVRQYGYPEPTYVTGNEQASSPLSVTFNSITNNATSLETKIESFNVNFTYNFSVYTLTNVYLSYNGTNYSATSSAFSDYILAQRTILVPRVSVTGTNIPYYWIVEVTNSSGNYFFNSDVFNQTVLKIAPITVNASCTFPNFMILNFTLKDENNRSVLYNGTIEYYAQFGTSSYDADTINGSLSLVNSIGFCVNTTLSTNWLIGSMEIFFYKDDYVKRGIFLTYENFTNSSTRQVNLNDLVSSSATSYVLYFIDNSGTTYSNYIVDIKRKYIPIDTFETIEMSRTDTNGKIAFYSQEQDVTYQAYLYDNYGLLVYVSPEFKALCVSTCSDEFRVPFSSITDIFRVLGTDKNFYYSYYLTDNNTYFNLPYQSIDSSGYDLKFRLYGNSLLNNSILICTRDVMNSNLGIFNCNITGLSYESYSFKLYLDDALKIQDTFNIPSPAKIGFLGLVIAFFMVLIFILLFIEDEKLMLIGAVIGIAVSLYFKFIMGGVVSIVFLVMGLGAVLLMDRK